MDTDKDARVFVYKFMTLPFHVRFTIGKEMGVLDDADYNLSSVDLSSKIVKKAREMKLFAALWKVVMDESL